jgi:hypothetical protein
VSAPELTHKELLLAEVIAERVAERIAVAPVRAGLVDATALAQAIGVSRDFIYDHASELGGKRIGDGPHGRLRFDLDRALAAWTSRSESGRSPQGKAPAQRQVSRRVRSTPMGSGAGLLPIRGSDTSSEPS